MRNNNININIYLLISSFKRSIVCWYTVSVIHRFIAYELIVLLVKRNIRVLELASIYHIFLHRDWFNIPLYLEGIVLICSV